MKPLPSPFKIQEIRKDIEIRTLAEQLIKAHENLVAYVEKVGNEIAKKKGDKGDSPSKYELMRLMREYLDEDTLNSYIEKNLPALTKRYLEGIVKPLIPEVKDGETPSESKLLSLITPLIPKPVNEDSIVKRIFAIINGSKKEKEFSINYEEIVKVIADKNLLRPEHILGLEEMFKTLKRTEKGYVHGGGVTELYAGPGITLVRQSNGNYTISSNGGGGANVVTQYVLTAVQSGNNVTIDLTQLANWATLQSITQLTRNNIPQTEGASYNFTVTGSVMTVFDASAGEIFNITYTYA